MQHLDLFSGIGGFALAARWAGIETVGFCEIEPFPQKVLRKNFPSVPIHNDIRDLDGHIYRGVDLITAGYPCQPFSRAGKQRGKEDDRHLWPEVFRIIKQAKPSWVVCENVVDHEWMGLDEVLFDLESADYATQSFVIPAGAKERDHVRERLWIVANNGRSRAELEKPSNSGQGGSFSKKPQRTVVSRGNREVGSERSQPGPVLFNRETFSVDGQSEPLFLGSSHGISHRLDRRRSLDNSIVPHIAYEIFRCLLKSEAR